MDFEKVKELIGVLSENETMNEMRLLEIQYSKSLYPLSLTTLITLLIFSLSVLLYVIYSL